MEPSGATSELRKDLADLRIIDLRGSRVPPAGVKELQLALPIAEILTDVSAR